MKLKERTYKQNFQNVHIKEEEENNRYNPIKGFGNGVYVLEKILRKRKTKMGKTLYFIKWMGYSSKDDTWELLREFEVDLPTKIHLSSFGTIGIKAKKRKSNRKNNWSAQGYHILSEETKLTGQEFIQILGIRRHEGKIIYLMKWKSDGEPVFLSSSRVMAHFPNLAIPYWEQQVKWDEPHENEF